MKETLSFHTGTQWSHDHNFNPDKRKEEKHIEPSLTDQNVVLKQETLLQAYEKCFGKSLKDYNQKQIAKGHPERQKGDIQQYLEDIQRKFQMERKAEGEKEGYRSVRPCYETIIQVGNRSTLIPRDEQIEILKDMYVKFQQENPNFYVFGAVIHADEKSPKDGKLSGIHMHLDYVPVARCARGMELQPVLSKAIEQGHDFRTDHARDTAQMKWQTHMRESLADVAREHGIEIVHKHENREHLEKEQYHLVQQNMEIEKQVQEQQHSLVDVRSAYDTVSKDLNDKRQELERTEQSLKQYQSIEPKRIILGTYRYNRDTVDQLVGRYNSLVKENEELRDSNKKLSDDRDRYKNMVGGALNKEESTRERLTELQEKQWDRDYMRQQLAKIERFERSQEHEREHEHSHSRERDFVMER